MINLKRIVFKGYKSFRDYAVLEGIGNVNLIIGKNNSGKSSILDVIDYIFLNDALPQYKPEEVCIGQFLTEEAIDRGFDKRTSGGRIGENYYQYGLRYLNHDLSYKLNRTVISGYGGSCRIDNKFSLAQVIDSNRAEPQFIQAVSKLFETLHTDSVRKISAERNIVPEEQKNCEVAPDGSGATSIISIYLNNSIKDEKVIEIELLNAFNVILGEDAHFDEIKVQQVEQPDKSYLWEIFLSENGNRYALSKMGSGLKTILLVLINLLVCSKEKKARVFLFEELENNLHPALQRRLFNFIYDYAIKNDVLIFMTSHSHVSINCYFDKVSTRIYHVEKSEGLSTVKAIENYLDKAMLLDDLDVRASDLLQSNGIIWVEGPSDRIYIKKWLSLVDPTLTENEHYQFAYYGGRLLSHYTASDGEELIKILLTNRNSAIVIDSDKRNKSTPINSTKKRIQEEFNNVNLFCWITKGKEIENYLSCDSISRKYEEVLPQVGQYELFPEYISKMDARFVHRKVEFARDMLEYILPQDLEILDLKHQMTRLAATIRQWNHIG